MKKHLLFIGLWFLLLSHHQITPATTYHTVLICNSSASVAYHTHRCRGLAHCKTSTSAVSISEAQKMHYRACRLCYH